jgi:hypothetical protein
MRLDTINRFLRVLGFVLVVGVDDGTGDEPTTLRLARAKRHPIIEE